MAKIVIGGQMSLSQATPSIDHKFGPYNSVAEAYEVLGENGMDVLCYGLTFGIVNEDENVVEYIIEKIPGSDIITIANFKPKFGKVKTLEMLTLGDDINEYDSKIFLYPKGSLVEYSNAVYKANKNTSGAWNNNDWDLYVLKDEIKNATDSIIEAAASAAEAKEDAQRAVEAAESTSTSVEKIKTAINNLPDGQAVSGQVALNTAKLSELEEDVEELKNKGGISDAAIDLLETILNSAVTVADQKSNIQDLIAELRKGGGEGVKSPVISINGATCTITSATDGASIRYTTNGTNPSSTVGTAYNAPFALLEDCTIKAVAYKDGNASSVVSRDYQAEPSGDYIVWEDPIAEQLAVAKWGSDGKVSYEQAAAVKSLTYNTSPFANSEVETLNELKYFTGVTTANDFVQGCSKLREVTFPANMLDAGCGVANLASVSSINIVGSPDKIGDAFARGTSVTSINVPSSVTKIGLYSFTNCAQLESINLPSGITEIGAQAFNGCSKLVFDELPSSLTSIGATCFKGCTSLGKVKLLTDAVPILGSATAIPSNMKIFVKDSLLASFKAAANWSSVQGQIYSINDWDNY